MNERLGLGVDEQGYAIANARTANVTMQGNKIET